LIVDHEEGPPAETDHKRGKSSFSARYKSKKFGATALDEEATGQPGEDHLPSWATTTYRQTNPRAGGDKEKWRSVALETEKLWSRCKTGGLSPTS
jgi:hypothetical protein